MAISPERTQEAKRAGQPDRPRPARRWSRRELLRRAALATIVAGSAGTLAAEYAHNVEPGWVEVAHIPLTLPRLAPAFFGYRVVQISDIHLGDWMTPDHLAEVVRMVNAEGPDLIAVTGDFITAHAPRYAPDLVATLKDLAAPDGVVAILGNHDHWSSAGAIREVIAASGMRDLNNRAYTLERGPALLSVAGVDDIWERKQRLDLALAALPREGAAILLAHEPDYADEAATTGRFDLQLSGHSHGGQVVLPFYGPLRLPPFGRKYPLGRYQIGRMIHYTNRGVGMVDHHLRFNCRPEISVFTLRAPGD